MKQLLISIAALMAILPYAEAQTNDLSFANVPVCGEAKMVYYDEGRYEAFTDIAKFKGKYYIAFRDSYSHIFEEDGTAQGHTYIIMSEDGENWKKIVDQAEPGIDLRDPKLSITPDGRLMVIMGGSKYGNAKENTACQGRLTRVSYSSDGEHFSTPVPVNIDTKTWNDWLWRVTWNEKKGYGFVKCDRLTLVKTRDGLNYKTIKDFNFDEVPGDESTIRFLEDGTMLALIRTKRANYSFRTGEGMWGVSKPPYKKWNITPLPFRLGGPNFIVVDDRYCIIASRLYDEKEQKTVLLKSDFKGNLTPVCVLPSGGNNGNCSYAGMLIEGKELWVCYYSQHETPKPAIYLVKLPMSMFE